MTRNSLLSAATVSTLLLSTVPAYAQGMTVPAGQDLFGMLFSFGVASLLFVLISFAIYMLPTIIAFRRKHPNRWIIALINFFFGVTFIGWILALVWSMLAIHVTSDGKIVNQTRPDSAPAS